MMMEVHRTGRLNHGLLHGPGSALVASSEDECYFALRIMMDHSTHHIVVTNVAMQWWTMYLLPFLQVAFCVFSSKLPFFNLRFITFTICDCLLVVNLQSRTACLLLNRANDGLLVRWIF